MLMKPALNHVCLVFQLKEHEMLRKGTMERRQLSAILSWGHTVLEAQSPQ